MKIYENFCKCCGQSYPDLPPRAWISYISGWHTVRIKTKQVDNEGIGWGNDPAMAAKEALEWWKKNETKTKRL